MRLLVKVFLLGLIFNHLCSCLLPSKSSLSPQDEDQMPPKGESAPFVTKSKKAIALLRDSKITEFKSVLAELKTEPDFPQCGQDGDEADNGYQGGTLVWLFQQNDAEAVKEFIKHEIIVDYIGIGHVGYTVDEPKEKIYGMPIMYLLKDIKKSGYKDVVKAFFLFEFSDPAKDVGIPRHRTFESDIHKLFLYNYAALAEARIPQDLKIAQALAQKIGHIVKTNVNDRTKLEAELDKELDAAIKK